MKCEVEDSEFGPKGLLSRGVNVSIYLVVEKEGLHGVIEIDLPECG